MEPVTLSTALAAVKAAKAALDAAALRRELTGIRASVDAVGRHLADTVLAELFAGYAHLEAAARVSDPEVRADELREARRLFAVLAERDEGGGGSDQAGACTATHVAALGHLGSWTYFLLRDEPTAALLEAYRCTERFPALGVRTFPVALFSKDYRGLVPDMSATLDSQLAAYRSALLAHEDRRRRYRADLAWRLPAAAGAVVLGFAGALVTPSMAARGVQAATGLLATSPEGLAPPTAPDRAAYVLRAQVADRLLEPVRVEAGLRRQELEATSRR